MLVLVLFPDLDSPSVDHFSILRREGGSGDLSSGNVISVCLHGVINGYFPSTRALSVHELFHTP